MSEYTTQYSRISHHTVALSATTLFSGSTFTVPGSELIDDTWSIYDLALSEIGVDEFRDKAYIRIGSNIKELNLGTGTTVTTPTLTQVLTAGNTTSGKNIEISTGDVIKNNNLGFINLNVGGTGQIRIAYSSTVAGRLAIDNDFVALITTGGGVYVQSGAVDIVTNTEDDFTFNTYAFKTIDIGNWDIAAATILNVAHGLSATEWKTIIDLNGFFRNDADTLRFNFGVNVANFGVSLPFIQKWDATNIILEPGTALTADPDYNGTGFSRGTLRFQYIPD
jgi:hypothetical protein